MVIKFANLNAKDNLVPLMPCIRPAVPAIYTYYRMYSFYLITTGDSYGRECQDHECDTLQLVRYRCLGGLCCL